MRRRRFATCSTPSERLVGERRRRGLRANERNRTRVGMRTMHAQRGEVGANDSELTNDATAVARRRTGLEHATLEHLELLVWRQRPEPVATLGERIDPDPLDE